MGTVAHAPVPWLFGVGGVALLYLAVLSPCVSTGLSPLLICAGTGRRQVVVEHAIVRQHLLLALGWAVYTMRLRVSYNTLSCAVQRVGTFVLQHYVGVHWVRVGDAALQLSCYS